LVTPGVRIPEGIRCNAKFCPSGRTTVCPALLPPWYRTTHCARSPSRSVALPLPSSPHWAPMSTIAGMEHSRRFDSTRIISGAAHHIGSGGRPVTEEQRQVHTMVLVCGSATPQPSGTAAPIARVPEVPGKKDVDPLIYDGQQRQLVAGTDAEFAAVTLRLLHNRRLAD